MPIDKDSIRIALARIPYPTRPGTNIVDAGAVSKVAYCDGYASVRFAAGGLHDDHTRGLAQQITAAIRLHAQQAGVHLADTHIEFTDDTPESLPPLASAPAAKAPPVASAGHRPIPIASAPTDATINAKHIIAVGAGKGGVGKSTIAVNLAVGLAQRGHAVGLMDGDIYGPSLPTMLGLGSLQATVKGSSLIPFYVHGIKSMTIGKLVDPEKPLIWRGPMAHGAFKQLVEQTEWGELDYLIIDLPPGTGDVALTMAQLLKLSGAIVVCTPQKVAQDDAIRALRMFQQLNIPILGVVENMSYFVGDDAKEYDLFGRGGAQLMAQRTGVPFLADIPVTMDLRHNSDNGNPTANFLDDSPRGKILAEHLARMVTGVENQIALESMKSGAATPKLSIS